MLTMPFVELAGLLIVVLLLSAGVVLWMKSQKRKPHPMMQLLILVLMLVLGFAGLKYGGEALGIIDSKSASDASSDPYRQALILLQEPYPAYTTKDNLSSANREALVTRFMKMEKLNLAGLKAQVTSLRDLIESAPASGQSGIYNMRMTSEIQARWDELRRELLKRVEQRP